VVVGNTAVVAGYQQPTAAFRIVKKGDEWITEDAWRNEMVSLYMANGVVVGDQLFSLSQRNSGQYVLLDVKTGKTVWTGKPREAMNAAIAKSGTLIFALEDDATFVIGRVANGRFDELKRYTVANSATWAQPAISGSRIFVKDVNTVALWTVNAS
jgi:outer membrane protein assembly factor BamB